MRISALFHRQRRCAFLWWLGWLLLWHHVIPGTSFEDEEDDESDGGGGGFGVGGGTTLEFTKSLYNASIYENAVVGRIYVTPTEKMGIFVKDPTVDIRYRIIEGDDDKMFKAEDHLVGDFCFLLIRIRMVGHDPPNREKTDEYRLRVQAWAKQRGRHRTREPSVTTLVMVKVLDTNDLRPLFHPIREYEATVPEDAPLHTTIVRVQAEDADVGINGEIYYSFLESTDQFAVQPTTGVVTLTRLLSYRNQGQFELTVVAQDRGTRSQGSEVAKVRPETAKLTISVREVNLHIPEFAVRHLPSIVEDGNVHIYAIVTVTDKDSGAQGEIASVVIADGDPNGHFRIYPGQSKNEYNIAVLKLVDRELSPNGYNLTLIATDKGIPSRHSSHRIPVRVTDFNDHPPVFDKAEYKVEIEEIAPVDTPLINVRATDADDGKNAEIVYRVEEGNEDATFTLDPHTGWLLLAKPLDAESRVTYILSVHAQDQGSNGMRKRGSCKIHIRVLDANDNDPVFTSDVADAWVKENEFISTVIHTVKAEDADYGENGYVSYSIANLNPTPFIVDHFSGEVKMKEVLDYERMRRNYTLKIRASDWGTPYRRQSETTVRVHLNDINDNRPQFERVDCTGYLSRGSPRNTEVITLSAIDFDAGSIVHYRIVSGNDDHCFAVNDTSGVVTLVCDLQHQPSTATASARERILNFTATDGEHFSDVMSVKITLVNTNPNQELANKYADFHCRKTDVAQRLTELMALVEKNNRPTNGDVLAQLPGRYGENKHAPEFIETMPSKIEVNESIAVGTKILDVKAIDRDLGFNGQVVYSISNGNVDGCFRIDMYNGSLFVVSSLDRERTSRYDLNISTWDLGRPQKMSFKSLIVDVGDYNDNPPIFLKSSFSLTLPENVRIGTTVVTFNATDRDVGLNARITYSLGTSTEDFVVDAVTGIMSVARSLDRERQGAYDLKVKAVDGSEELPLTATAAVLILVSDINDNVPRFAAERFTARVLEDLPVGTVVTTLSAYDPDLEEGGQVHYTLKNGGNDCFRVDRTTGTVRITRKLDFEERKMYNMTMEACDGDVTSLCSSAGLLVEVVDVNENFHSPKFDNFYANGSLRENEPIGTWVLKVTATDDDRTEMDSRIAYSIRDGDGLGRFSIDDQGNIRSLEAFDRETTASYWLTVYAQDRGAIPLASRLDVYIEIVDVNDNVPLTKEPVYFASVPENSPPDTSVVQIEAYDLDLDPNQLLSFRITSGNPQGFFKIDPDTGLITTTSRRLDREAQEEHELEVSVSDNGEPLLSSTTRVVITVTDVNDNTPRFLEASQHIRILEVPVQTTEVPLFRVVTEDLDIGPNSDVSYTLIKNGRLNGRFKIHPKTGVVSSQNLTAGEEFELTVRAEDNGRPRKYSIGKVLLTILARPTSSASPPLIQNLSAEVKIVENELVGHFVAQIQAKDLDDDVLFFDIIDGNANDDFTVNCNSGLILLAKSLDFEVKNQYDFNISVTDGVYTVFSSLVVKVVDFNDNRPQFSQPLYEVEVSENIPPGTEILQIEASDRDEDKRLVYAIQSSAHSSSMLSFRIDPKSGLLEVADRLDREAVHTHILTVLVRDHGLSSKRNFVRVVIRVLDHNDHAPTFLSAKFEGKVYETSAIGTSVVQVLAVDRDKGKNAEIQYSILSGNMGSAFSIDPLFGVVSVVKELDVRTMPEYLLTVRATDSGNPPLSNVTTVHIEVTIADDAPPKFDSLVYTAEIQENLHEGSSVIIVSAFSLSTVYYEISDSNRDRLFVINPNSGVISCTEPLDYETNNFFNLTVRATNMVDQHASCSVLIYVLDTNDNSPVFKKTEYIGNVTESAVIGSFVLDEEGNPLVASAEDRDSELNSRLEFEIVEKVAQKWFRIDRTTGAIQTLSKLDHEIQSVFDFTVQVRDKGIPSRMAELTAKIKIFVNDVNDSPPTFENSSYNATVLLPTYVGVLVTTVKAHDPDSEAVSELKYKVTSGNADRKFAIDEITGAITIRDSQNLKDRYDLMIHVSDGVYAAKTRVIINLESMPITGLRFGQEDYYANVMENSSEASTVAVVNVIGTDLNEHVVFRILNPEGLFQIGETSGVLRTTGVPFDREVKDEYEIVVEAQSQYDTSKKAHALVHVNVMDVNDNRPIFMDLPYYAVVPMSAKKGDLVFKVKAIDFDIGDNGEVNYELLDRAEGVFQMHRKTGEITLMRTLNDPTRVFNLRIIADDGGMDPLQEETTLTIKVIHNRVPVFKSQYYQASIKENIQPYSPVLSIEAVSPERRKLIYSIVDGNPYEEFAIDFNTDPDRSNGPCVIYVVDNLDYETTKSYQLTVRATDSVTGEFANVFVNILIEDVNDNSPNFTQASYNAYVMETAEVGKSIATVSATDRDSGLNRLIHYHILNKFKNSTDLFHINAEDGTIILKKKLDYEKERVHDFVILASDNGVPSLSATSRMWIHVQDRNDNPPYFEQSSYNCFLSEEAQRGQFVSMVVAFDPDADDQAKLTYAIVAGNDQQVFSINEKTGILILGNPYKLNQFTSHTLNVSVSDGVHTSYTRIKVDVILANRHAPEFTRAIYDVNFEENSPPGSLVATVLATDNDRGSFGQVEYDIQSDHLLDYFAIDSETGKIMSKKVLDREIRDLYEVPIMAIDAGSLTAYTLLRVSVVDKNDNQPVFRIGEYKANVHSNSTIGTKIIQVSAFDADSGMAAAVEYSIYESQDSELDITTLFGINEFSGEIFLRQTALKFENQVFQFFVRAEDKGLPPLHSDVPVTILIINPYDTPPTFHQRAHHFFILENAPIGTVVATLTVTSNESVTYSLASTYNFPDGNSPFEINENNEIVVSGSLDRELVDVYVLDVKAETQTSPPLTTYTNFTVQIMDENDNVPEFECSPYHVAVSENVIEGTSFMRVIAKDRDVGQVRFSLRRNSPSLSDMEMPFNINSHTGWITTSVKLDRELVSSYSLIVVATDSGNPPLSSTTTVKIDVKDYNDNPPVFFQNLYRAAVNEDAMNGTVVIILTTHDADIGLNARVAYYITKGDPNGHFNIRPTGEIYVNKELDRETIDNYNLEITATDGTFVSTCRVSIDILDANDSPPICKKSKYYKKIPENIMQLSYLLTVEASDNDEKHNARLQYFLSGHGAYDFILDRNNGFLKTAKPLDRETIPRYVLSAHVQDVDHPDWECISEIEIILSDINDNPPNFTDTSYSVTVPEDTEVKMLVFKVHASDKDIGINRKIRYSFVDSANGHFVIDDMSGLITLAKPLDREQRAMYNLTVRATDIGTPQLSTLANVLVIVLDINDNPPEFASKFYYSSVPENSNLGVEVVRVLATSKDSGINAEITYSIVGGNEHGMFDIHPETGAVIVKKALDYETAKEYLLTVQANDGGTPSLSNHCSVNVSVIDTNDNPPIFVQNAYSVAIREDAQVGDRVLQVVASDMDSPANGRVTYYIIGGDKLSHFKMEKYSGYLTVATALDRESISRYSIEVKALDSGMLPMFSTVKISIEVTDANDNPPLFSMSNYSAFIQENKPERFSILKFLVMDADTQQNGPPFSFEIPRGNEGQEFLIDQDGTLKTDVKFTSKSKRVYVLQVRVYDNGTPTLFSDTWVTVRVIEESRYPPVVKALEVNVNSYNNEFPGGIIGRVRATDQDPYDNVLFSIVSKHRYILDINSEDGSLTALPGLIAGIYHVNVSASDGKFTSYGEVKIIVKQITDEMQYNAIVMRFKDVTPEEFVVDHQKSFIRAIKNLQSVNVKDVDILSMQPASQESTRMKRDSKQDLDVMFTVCRSKSRMISSDTLLKAVTDQKSKIEAVIGLKILRLFNSLCTPNTCHNGECSSHLEFDSKEVIMVTTSTSSFVSPRHHHRLECHCTEGFGGKNCDVIVNECARATCPRYKVCIPDESPIGYKCECPPGKYDQQCLGDLEPNCVDNNCHELVKNPVSFRGKSYAAYTFMNAMDRYFSLSLKLRTVQSRSCLVYSTGKIDYSILEVVNGFMQYRFECGSGEGLVRDENVKINDGQWHEVSLNRRGSAAEILIDQKFRSHGSAPGFNDVLNVEPNDVYFGAEVMPRHFTQDYEDIRMGFIGCMGDIRVDDIPLPLQTSTVNSIASLKRFVNVEYHCPAAIDPGICGSHPCLNGGTCKSVESSSYTCLCHPRFKGRHCEMDTNPCASSPCLNGGSCSNRPPNSYSCDCPVGLKGKRCELGRHCNPNPCDNGGTCEEGPYGPICKCIGYFGSRCTIDIDECSDNPCHNGATCHNMPGSFRCQCVPNTTGTYCESVVKESAITSSPSGIMTDEVIGIITTLVLILLIVLIFVIVRKYRLKRARQRQNNVALEPQKEVVVMKNKTQDDIKRTSKVSNLEAYTTGGHHNHPPHVPSRPLSYTPSNHDSYSSALNNYETVCSYGSAGDDLENINRYSNEFLQVINKPTSIPPSLPPPPPSNSPSDSDSLHKPWCMENNLKDNYCETKIQNDMKCHVSLPDVPLTPAENFRDNIPVPCASVVPSVDEDLPGYHWDCSDWARGQNPLPNITEVPTNEVPDSPSVHSNESNSQVGGEDRSTSTILGPFGGGAGLRRGVISPKDPHFPQLTQHLLSTNSEDDGDRDSEYVGDSELNDNDLDDPGNREPLQPRFEQLLPLDDDGDSSDTYLPSCLNYHLHPNQYLPNYDNITAANTDTEGDDNGSLTGGVGINNLVLRRCPPLSSSMTTAGGRATVGGNNNSNYGYLGHHQRMSRIHDPRRSLELPAGDDMSVSVGGYTSTNASCSDISGNLCEIEDSEVFSDVDMDVEDLEVKKVVQNTASTAL